uniref:Lipid transfer-like protein VAS n=1 Tax=Cajanus cajan TaxID=3821 RepID=A0A151RNI0_CAJCA|nr:Lipid transfer-like protein VAS [Cajanus cajan]
METMLRELCCIAFLVLLTCIPIGSAQQSSCLNKLSPCLNYLNGTEDPPDSCCEPLKSVIESDAGCLCSLVSNRGTKEAEQAGININEAQQLPGRCGKHVNPLSCLNSMFSF